MPQFQLLPEQPTTGQMISRSLGAGFGQGIQESLAKYQETKKSQRQLAGLTPFLKEFIPENEIEKMVKSGLEPKTIIDLSKILQEKKQLESYQKSLGQFQEPSISEQEIHIEEPSTISPKTPTKEPSLEAAKPKPLVSVKPVLASHQLPPPVSARDIPTHSAARLQAKQLGFNQNKKTIESINTEAKKSREMRPIIKRAAQLVKKGGVGGIKGATEEKLAETFGPFFKSPDVAEFQRLQKEMTVGNFRSDFGARPSQSEFFYITDVYGRPGDSKEALLRKLVLEDWKAQIEEKREDAMNNIFRKYGEYPLNLNEMIEAQVKPTYDKFLEATGYNKWEKKQAEAKPLTDEIMRKYLRANNNNPDKALEALQKDNYKVIE